MRSLLVVATLGAIVHADPMKPVSDACAALKASPDPKAKCEAAGRLTVKGLGTVELSVAKLGGVSRYALVASDAGKVSMSSPVELLPSNCAMQKCEILDDARPALRAATIDGQPAAVAIIDQRYHHEHTDDRTGKAKQVIDDRWTATSVIACAPVGCVAKTWGGRGNACKVQVKPDGNAVATCETTELLAIDGAAAGGLDPMMDDANKAFDRGDFQTARERANAVLAKQPTNVRMLRLVVSIGCMGGDAATARAAAKKLPAADLDQMKKRCGRYGVDL